MKLKYCTDCRKHLPVDNFHSAGVGRKVSFCKSCASSEFRLAKARKRVAEYQARNRDDPGYKDRRNATNRRIRATVSGQAMSAATSNRYKERQLNLDAMFNKTDAAFIYRQFGFKCFKCESTKNKTIDHHRPLSQGNALTRQNAVLLCRSCNSSKGDKAPEDFYTPEEMAMLIGLGKA